MPDQRNVASAILPVTLLSVMFLVVFASMTSSESQAMPSEHLTGGSIADGSTAYPQPDVILDKVDALLYSKMQEPADAKFQAFLTWNTNGDDSECTGIVATGVIHPSDEFAIFVLGPIGACAVAADSDNGLQPMGDEDALEGTNSTDTVSDTTPPVIAIPGDNPLAIDQNGTYSHPAVTCEDAVDGAISDITVTGTVDTAVPGTYTVTFGCTDAAGNPAAATLTVHIRDATQPAITIPGDNPLAIDQNGTYSHPAVTCEDAVDGAISDITVTGTVDTAVPGTYTVTFGCTDAAGNPAAATLTVHIRDATQPAITIPGDNPLAIDQNGTYSHPAVTCEDAVDGAISDITVTGTVDTAVPET